MKGAKQCAQRLGKVLRSLRSKAGRVAVPPTGDPIRQLILGIFSRDVPEVRAKEALNRLLEVVVDYNDLRVMAPAEMAEVVSKLPDARRKCEDLSRALNWIFLREHDVTLDHLLEASKKDVLAYLDQVEGLDAYTKARIRLLGLGRHAFPLDSAMWEYACQTGIVAPQAPHEEAQAFLERQIPEKDALSVFAMMRKVAWAEYGAKVRRGTARRVTGAPLERTTTHMLAELQEASGTRQSASAVVDAEPEPQQQGQPRPAPTRKATTRRTSKRATKRAAEAKSTAKRTASQRTPTRKRQAARGKRSPRARSA